MRTRRNLGIFWAALFVTMFVTGAALGQITQYKDSADFDWLYEFEGTTADLPSNLDLDANGIGDFSATYAGGVNTVAGGVLTMASTSGGAYNWFGCLADDGTLWRNVGFPRTGGVTLETRLKVVPDETYVEGSWGAFSLAFTTADSDVDAALYIRSNGQGWLGSGFGFPFDNTDDFHTYRIALETDPVKGNETYSVWRDSVLIGTTLGDTDPRTELNRLIVGDAAGNCSGKVEVDYVRLASGSWAPTDEEIPPIPTVADLTTRGSATFDWKYEFEGDTADLPSNLDIDANGSPDFDDTYLGGTNSVQDGVLSMSSTEEVGYNFLLSQTSDGLWRSVGITREEGATVEFRAKVTTDAANSGSIGAGCVSFTAADSYVDGTLYVGPEGLHWMLTPIGDTQDNTDDFHTFRIAMMPTDLDDTVCAVWRDGELVAEGLGDTDSRDGLFRMLVGDGAGAAWGDMEIDYLRFTAGAYAPEAGEEPLPGDLNDDGFVGGDDLDIVRSFWGQNVTEGDLGSGDPSNDGFVGGDDLDIVRANWGQGTPPAPNAIPEPCTGALLVSSLIALVWRVRR